MTPAQEDAVRNGGYAAAHLAAICALMATTLLADPDTAKAGEAVEGISQFARRLSNDLLNLCE